MTTENLIDNVRCAMYTVDEDLRIDLLVHPDDVDSTTEAVGKHVHGHRFRVVPTDSIVPGRMVAVDKAGLLRKLIEGERP